MSAERGPVGSPEARDERECTNCGDTIHASNGYVLARDFLMVLDGVLAADEVNQLCGRCVERGAI